MKIDESGITNRSDVRLPIEVEIFSGDAKEIELSRRVFDLLLTQLVIDKLIAWTGETSMLEIKSFYYPISNCKITAIQ